MANQFVNLPVPVGNGVGAPVDVSTFGASKSIVVGGTAQAQITVEVNNDAGQLGSWSALQTFQGAGELVVSVACRWMRVRVASYNPHVGGTSDVSVGGTTDGTTFQALAAPVGNGVAASSGTSTLGLFKTVQVGGKYRGTVLVEVSEDGTEWSQPFSFGSQSPGIQTLVIAADFMRVRRGGVPKIDPGLPIVNVAACVDGGGGSGGIGVNVEDEGVPIAGNPHQTLNFIGAGVTATDAGGGVADITIPGGGGGGSESAANVLTYRPGSADVGPIVFNTWAALYARLVVLRDNATTDTSGRFVIVFDDSLAAVVIASDGATYNLTDTELLGVRWEGPDRVDVLIGDGAGADVTLTGLLLITGLAITSTQTAPPIQTVESAALTLVNTLIDATGDGTISVIAANFTTIRLGDESVLQGRAGVPAVALSGDNRLEIWIDGADAVIAANSLGSAGASDQVLINAQSSSGIVSLTQPDLVNALSWQGDSTTITTRVISRSGPFMPPINGGATPVDLTAFDTIGYVIEVTGAAATVLLPSVAPFEKGELIVIKRVDNPDETDLTVTVTPFGAEKIDNLATYPLTGVRSWLVLEARGGDALDGWSGWNVIGQGPLPTVPAVIAALPEKWNQNVVAASQTDVAISALVSVNFDTIKAIRAGSIVGIGWRWTDAISAGTATINATINGAATTISGVSTNVSNQTGGQSVQAAGIDAYAAGALIGVQITTDGAFAPDGATNLEVWLEVTPT